MAILLPIGRTTPVTITVPSHVPKISELRLLSVQSNPPTLDLQFLASDPSADLGASPHVWFMMGCGGELVPGIVHGKGNSVVRASIPGPASGRCDLQVRVIDGLGIESNTLRTTVEFKN